MKLVTYDDRKVGYVEGDEIGQREFDRPPEKSLSFEGGGVGRGPDETEPGANVIIAFQGLRP